MTKEKFSFIIPSYNDSDGIRSHLQMFSRLKENVELVIIDDCSEDDTGRIIEAVERPENVDVVYKRLEKNSGPAVARNTGIKLVTGDYVMFLDADDLLHDCFFNIIRYSPLTSGADFVLFKYHLSDDRAAPHTYNMHKIDNAFFSGLGNSGFPVKTYAFQDIPEVLATINFPWNKVYRREFLQESGVYFPDMRMHEDILPHWLSFMRSGSFGILAWAPPLVTHFEEEGGNRATNYVGEHRMQLFPMLETLAEEVTGSKHREEVWPHFRAFTDDLFVWLVDVVCAGDDAESKHWRTRYQEEIDQCRETLAEMA